jgi:hypothetical protein
LVKLRVLNVAAIAVRSGKAAAAPIEIGEKAQRVVSPLRDALPGDGDGRDRRI